LKAIEGKNVPLTLNAGVVFVYSGEDWELFSNAIRQTVDKLQEERQARRNG
jgi:hypothetical protein